MGFVSRRLNRDRVRLKRMQKGREPDLLYHAQKLGNDDFIRRFVVVGGAKDPGMFVETEAPDGTLQRWLRIEEDGQSVFLPPDGYAGGPIAFVHDKGLLAVPLVYESSKTFSLGAKR